MRILYLNYLHDINGASFGSVIKPRRIFEEMIKMGHDIHIEWMAEELHGQRIRDYAEGKKSRMRNTAGYFLREPKSLYYNRGYFKKENALVEAYKPELIIGRLEYAIFSFVNTAQKYDLPLIVEADAPPFYEAVHFHPKCIRNPWLVPAIEKYVIRHARHTIMQSRQLYEYYLNRCHLDPEKVSWVSNGADIDKYTPVNKAPHLLKQYELTGKFIVGFIGSLGSWHGTDHLIQIIEAVVKSHFNVVFMIVGAGGTDAMRFRTLLQEKNLMHAVRLTGRVDHERIPEVLNLMDIVLAPYPKFDFFYFSPIKLFEYMAAGKVLLSTNVGQIGEIIHDGKNGVFCDPENASDVASKIIQLMNDDKLRQSIGKNARITIEKEHTWAHKAKLWESVCQKVLNTGNYKR